MTQLLQEFQEFRNILCVCPCCGDIVRISDLKLSTKKTKEKSWLDDYEKKVLAVAKLEEKFEEEKDALREQSTEKGRKAAEAIFNNAISPSLKKLKYNPLDIKPVFYPIDFLVFNGMNGDESIDNLVFLSKISTDTNLNKIRKNVEMAITNKKYCWQEARIDDSGEIAFK